MRKRALAVAVEADAVAVEADLLQDLVRGDVLPVGHAGEVRQRKIDQPVAH
jgi:hypothetical protein